MGFKVLMVSICQALKCLALFLAIYTFLQGISKHVLTVLVADSKCSVSLSGWSCCGLSSGVTADSCYNYVFLGKDVDLCN